MRAIPGPLACLALALLGGCRSPDEPGQIDRRPPTLPETLQACGRFPGLDPTFYAYIYYKGTATQVYRQSVPEITTATFYALADLGYRDVKVCPGSPQRVEIQAVTDDGRPAHIVIRCQGGMSRMYVRIGACGDEPVSKALTQRVVEYFGTIPPNIIPLEPALERRLAFQYGGAPSAAPTIRTLPDATPGGATPSIMLPAPAPAPTPPPAEVEGPSQAAPDSPDPEAPRTRPG